VNRRAAAALGLAGAAAIAATAVPSGNAKDRFDLKGEVYGNTAFKIEMKNAAGRKLTRIKAGTYRIKIEDKATIHNFRLKGPGVNRATSTPRMTETIWTVRLKPGRYVFVCDPHATTMRGSFRVTAANA
jgi:plastocyanin